MQILDALHLHGVLSTFGYEYYCLWSLGAGVSGLHYHCFCDIDSINRERYNFEYFLHEATPEKNEVGALMALPDHDCFLLEDALLSHSA